MDFINQTDKLTKQYLPIYLEALRIDSIIDFDLYIKVNNDMILYRAADLPFTDRTRSTLLDNNVKTLYVPGASRVQYQKYIESNIDQIVADETIPEPTKAGIVYDSTKLLVRDVLTNPTLSENIRRSQNLVESSVYFIMSGKEAFHNILKVMSFDYYTYTHSVNVCTFSVAFAQYLGHTDEELLNQLGTGALLHDVGKTKISDRILNKRTELNDLEIEIIRKHPVWGVEIIQKTDLIHKNCYIPILQHHERENGTGYPSGCRGTDIHLFGKIVGIADTFDAMTTRRAYQQPVATFSAMKTMFSIDGAFDRQLLERFAYLMGPTKVGQK